MKPACTKAGIQPSLADQGYTPSLLYHKVHLALLAFKDFSFFFFKYKAGSYFVIRLHESWHFIQGSTY
jgi:hypothetical protein